MSNPPPQAGMPDSVSHWILISAVLLLIFGTLLLFLVVFSVEVFAGLYGVFQVRVDSSGGGGLLYESPFLIPQMGIPEAAQYWTVAAETRRGWTGHLGRQGEVGDSYK